MIKVHRKAKRKSPLVKLFLLVIFILGLLWIFTLVRFGSRSSSSYNVIDQEFLHDLMPSKESPTKIQKRGNNDDDYVTNDDDDNENNDDDGENDKKGKEEGDDDSHSDGSSYLTMYGDHRAKLSLPQLPGWIQRYIQWNRDQRNRPLEEEPEKKYLVLMCLADDNSCGGLSDRFRGVLFYLFIAKITNRLLCFYWTRPFPLETFLDHTEVGIDWTCPNDLPSLVNHDVPTGSQRKLRVYYWHDCQKSPRHEAQEILPCVQRELRNIQNSSDDRFAVTRLFGNTVEAINHLNMLAQMYSYKDMMPIINQWQHPDITHDLFRVLFKPKPHLARRVNATMTELGLVEDKYLSVHVRARYPARGLAKGEGGRKKVQHQIDKQGILPFEGSTKEYLVNIMNNAIECGHMLAPDLPIYFATDHNNATNFMLSKNYTFSDGTIIQPKGIQSDKMPVHVGIREFQQFHASDYYSVFEDLLIMGGSRCVSHGIGSFGSFGAGLTGNKCRTIHRKHTGQIVRCPNDRGDQMKLEILEKDKLFPEIGDEWSGKIECNITTIHNVTSVH